MCDLFIVDGVLSTGGRDESESSVHVDCRGLVATPAFIDIHCHPAGGFSWLGVDPDEVGLNTGVTLLCDGGTAGDTEPIITFETTGTLGSGGGTTTAIRTSDA